MRTNGTLQIQRTLQAVTDEHGEPLTQAEVWSKDIPCLITTNADNRLGIYEDGEYRVASYSVLVEDGGMLTADDTRRIRLKRCGVLLGEFRVMSIEPIETFSRLRINV